MTDQLFLQLIQDDEVVVEVELPQAGSGGFVLEIKKKKIAAFNRVEDELVTVSNLSSDEFILHNGQLLTEPQVVSDGDTIGVLSKEFTVALFILEEDSEQDGGEPEVEAPAPELKSQPEIITGKKQTEPKESKPLPKAAIDELPTEQQSAESDPEVSSVDIGADLVPERRSKAPWLLTVLLLTAAAGAWLQQEQIADFIDSLSNQVTGVSATLGDGPTAQGDKTAATSSPKGEVPAFQTTIPEPLPDYSEQPESSAPTGEQTTPEEVTELTAMPPSLENVVLEQIWRHDLGSAAGCLSAHGDLLAVGTADGSIQLLSASKQETIKTLKHHVGSISQLALSNDGSLLLAGSYDSSVSLWRIPGDTPHLVLDAHPAPVRSIDLSADNSHALTADVEGMIIYWDLATGEDIRLLLGHAGIVNDVQFSADAQTAVSAGIDGKLILWDLQSGERLLELDDFGVSVNAVDFSPDGKHIVVIIDNFTKQPDQLQATGKQSLLLVEIKSGNVIDHFETTTAWLLDVNYSVDGSLVVAAAGGDPGLNDANLKPGIMVWNARDGKQVASALEQTKIVNGARFIGNHMIGATSLNHTIRIWKPVSRTGE